MYDPHNSKLIINKEHDIEQLEEEEEEEVNVQIFYEKYLEEIILQLNSKNKKLINDTEQQDIYDNETNIENTLILLKFMLNVIDTERTLNNNHENNITPNGVEFTDLILDYLNYEAGYHSLTNFEEQSITPSQNEQNTQKIGFKDFIDTVLFIDGYSRLNPYKDIDKRVKNFTDHLILRSINKRNQRTHIPIILESCDSGFFSKDIFDFLSLEFTEIGGLDFGRPNYQDLKDVYINWTTDLQTSFPKWSTTWNIPNVKSKFQRLQTVLKVGGKKNYNKFIKDVFSEENSKFNWKVNQALNSCMLSREIDEDREKVMFQLVRIFSEYTRKQSFGVLYCAYPFSEQILNNTVFAVIY